MPLTTQLLKEFGDERFDNAYLDALDNASFVRIRRRTFWLNGILDALTTQFLKEFDDEHLDSTQS